MYTDAKEKTDTGIVNTENDGISPANFLDDRFLQTLTEENQTFSMSTTREGIDVEGKTEQNNGTKDWVPNKYIFPITIDEPSNNPIGYSKVVCPYN